MVSSFDDEFYDMTNNIIDQHHPAMFLKTLAQSVPPTTRFKFEIYKRINKEHDYGFIDDMAGNLTASELSDSWDAVADYVNAMSNLTQDSYGHDYEYGIQSATEGYGHERYIPMIDFVGRPDKESISHVIESLSKIVGPTPFWLYDSGRSFHAYAEALMSPLKRKRFNEYLAFFPNIVDVKWVEHYNKRGYGILRWSAISSRHVMMPKFVEKIIVS